MCVCVGGGGEGVVVVVSVFEGRWRGEGEGGGVKPRLKCVTFTSPCANLHPYPCCRLLCIDHRTDNERIKFYSVSY